MREMETIVVSWMHLRRGVQELQVPSARASGHAGGMQYQCSGASDAGADKATGDAGADKATGEQGADIKSQAYTVAIHTDEFATSLYLTFYAYSIVDGKRLPAHCG